MRLADAVGTAANPVTLINGRGPLPQELADNGGAQARLVESDFEGVTTSDGVRHPLTT